jgi:hypothetical protein
MRRWAVVFVLAVSTQVALGQEPYYPSPQPGSSGPAFGPPGMSSPQPASPYEAAWPPRPAPDGLGSPMSQPSSRLTPPPPGGSALSPQLPSSTLTAPPTADRTTTTTVFSTVPLAERCTESTWYYRLESLHWNERVDGVDFVNEYGPISTLGYQRRNGNERFRVELFGGTVAYDGAAQLEDGTLDPYHQSFGTNYLGCRGEYDLLFDPWTNSPVRFFVGLGTRFWIRDLRDAVTPDGVDVMGYQETWWTFYPYVGIETKEPIEPGMHFYCSARIGATPLTYQHASWFDTTVYPRCGLTGNVQVGARYSGFLLAAYLEVMTWTESAMVRYSFQPESSMLTVGGCMAYTF